MPVLDLLATAVFGVSGGLAAVRMRLDLVGVVCLAVVTGLGGGWVRDVLIGATPPAGLSDWRYLVTTICGGLIAFFLHPQMSRMAMAINVFDAFGLGLFSVAGAIKASEHGLSPVPAATLGLVTGVGGGVLRDVLGREVPTILRKGELYAIPAAAGAALAVVGYHLGWTTGAVIVMATATAITWRLFAIWRRWTSPEPAYRPIWPSEGRGTTGA